MNSLPKLQVVILDCPVRTFTHPFTQKMFGKFVQMKLVGYQNDYAKSILPFGSFDFISSLVLLCERKDEELEPLACFKYSTLNRAKEYQFPFELLNLFQSKDEEEHKVAVNDTIQNLQAQNQNIGYSSSWTIAPALRKNPILGPVLKDLSLAIMLNLCKSTASEMMLGGTLRFKVEQVMAPLGFKALEHNEKVLPPVNTWFANGEPVIVMHLKTLSPYAIELMKKYEPLWEHRTEVA